MLTFPVRNNATVPTPPAGYHTYFHSIELGVPAYKDDAGVVHTLEGVPGPRGRIGPVGYGEEIDYEPILIPGKRGLTGNTGATGATGASGSRRTIIVQQEDAEDGLAGFPGRRGADGVGGGGGVDLYTRHFASRLW